MKCPACGLEMFLYSAKSGEGGERSQREYVCGNKRCPRFDERMRRKTATAETKTTQEC